MVVKYIAVQIYIYIYIYKLNNDTEIDLLNIAKTFMLSYIKSLEKTFYRGRGYYMGENGVKLRTKNDRSLDETYDLIYHNMLKAREIYDMIKDLKGSRYY